MLGLEHPLIASICSAKINMPLGIMKPFQFKAEPLVPIGCLTTAYFLGSGIKSFYNRDPARSQTMMRLRVASQFATIMICIWSAGWNAVTFQLAPGMAVPSEQGHGKKGREGDAN